MGGRRIVSSLVASPIAAGAITTLIVIVAVFLAYNANQGLPFVPVYRVSVEVPNAARLVSNNEVRIGGHRVGVVESMEAVEAGSREAGQGAFPPADGGAAGAGAGHVARLNLKLDKEVQPIPVDSVFRVRYRSSFGLKYLEITRGDGKAAAEGHVFDDPQNFIAQTEFDDINNTFDAETRENNRINLVGFGDAFAGRGVSLNLAFEQLEPLFRNLEPVAGVLSARQTRLGRFFRELGDSARVVAPLAEEQAQLFTNMAITFAAISEDVAALQETISEGPPTLETGIETLPRQRPFLRDLTRLSRELRPGISDLRPTLPVLNEAIEVGTPVLRDSVRTNRELRRVLGELDQLLQQPETSVALSRLGETFQEARSFLSYFLPYQTRCNLVNHGFYPLWEHISQRDEVGFLERTTPVSFPGETEGSPAGYAGITANGRNAITGVFEPDELVVFHDDAYDVAVDEQGRTDCQAGQGGYSLGQDLLPGQRLSDPSVITSDSPVLSGPTFGGERGR